MTQAIAHILDEAEQLSFPERAELTDLLVADLTHEIPAEIESAQLAEVRRRIAEVESGEVALIPGDEVLAHMRQLVASARAAG